MIKEYVKKPVTVEALEWTGQNVHDMMDFIGSEENITSLELVFNVDKAGEALIINTLEGDLEASVGDYVIRGVKGEFYPCKPDIFKLTYEAIQ